MAAATWPQKHLGRTNLTRFGVVLELNGFDWLISLNSTAFCFKLAGSRLVLYCHSGYSPLPVSIVDSVVYDRWSLCGGEQVHLA
jgi:hypothetical protein